MSNNNQMKGSHDNESLLLKKAFYFPANNKHKAVFMYFWPTTGPERASGKAKKYSGLTCHCLVHITPSLLFLQFPKTYPLSLKT